MAIRILRYREVLQLTGVSRKTIERWFQSGRFPKPIKLGRGPKGAVGFLESEVDAWIEARPRAES